jgi:hypothetical protein
MMRCGARAGCGASSIAASHAASTVSAFDEQP